MKNNLLYLVLLISSAVSISEAQLNVLHSFAGGANDGQSTRGSLIQDGTTLYGMTEKGGSSNKGTIIKIETDGSGFSVIHSFAGGTGGRWPYGSLIQDGTTLYGMTSAGGLGGGTIFTIETDGSGFSVMHSFVGGDDDGAIPRGSLIQSGTTLYGMTKDGGSSDFGIIFKIETDGSGFALLHSFVGGDDDGVAPYGSLIQDGTTLYGMTTDGGFFWGGTIFKIETDGSGFSVLYSFEGWVYDGMMPFGSLIQNGTTLYGMTSSGGNSDNGSIFKIETDGSDYNVMHLFALDRAEGLYPFGSLLLDGTKLYGMSIAVDSGAGTIFKIETDGSGYNVMHSFVGGADDGATPYGSLIQDGITLYGMTSKGGSPDRGVIFSFPSSVNISGYVTDSSNNGIGGVTITFSNSGPTVTTDASGFYSAFVIYDWSGTATPSKAGLNFIPNSVIYSNVIADFTDQDYVASSKYVVIYGSVTRSNNNGVEGVEIVFSNGGGTVTTDANGAYSAFVPYDWSGTATPSKAGFTFEPTSNTYSNVKNDFTDQDYVALSKYVVIYGSVTRSNNNGVEGVEIEFSNSGGTVTTDANGDYYRFITRGWSGTATPSKTGLIFSPSSISYSNISNSYYNQDYIALSQYVYAHISGNIKDINDNPLEGVKIEYSNSGQFAITDAIGYYEMTITKGWDGTATPSMGNFSFEPSQYSYSNIAGYNYNQDFVGTDLTLAVNDVSNSLPTEFTVLPAYPNPFNPSTTIRYGLATDSFVSIEIYDITGRLISTLINTEQTQGWHAINWTGTNNLGEQVPAGIYLSKITSGTKVQTTKLMLLR